MGVSSGGQAIEDKNGGRGIVWSLKTFGLQSHTNGM